MPNTALNRTGVLYLTNKSGAIAPYGAVVVISTANASAFDDTVVSGYVTTHPAVVIEPNGIAIDAVGLVAVSGWVPIMNLASSATAGQFIKTHTVTLQGTPHSAPAEAGDFAIALTASATPEAVLFGGFIPAIGGGLAFTDGDKGDITVSGSGATFTIDTGVVTNAKRANIATARFSGRVTAGTGVPEDLTGTQATTLLDAVTSALKGLAPASGGGTVNYLRADGTWAAPPGDADPLILTGSISGTITMTAAATTTPYAIVWPAAQGAAVGDVLTNAFGTLTWAQPPQPPFVDTVAIVKGSGDATKQLVLEVDGNTAGSVGIFATTFSAVRTLTFPDVTDTMVARTTTDSFTNKSVADAMTYINASAPVAAADSVKLSAADTDAAAGKSGLHVTTEDSTLHVFGDKVGLGIVTSLNSFLHVSGPDGAGTTVTVDAFNTAATGSQLTGRHARGTRATPTVLSSADILVAMQGNGYVRNAANSADAYVGLGRMRFLVDGLDAQGRAGGSVVWGVSAGVSAAIADVMTLDKTGHLTLSAGGITIASALDHNGTTIGFFGVTPAVRASAYTPTNVTPDRAYDADTVVVAELADIVGTLIADLKLYGILQ